MMMSSNTEHDDSFGEDMITLSNSLISEKVKEKVESVLWLDRLKADEVILQQRIKNCNPTDDRCLVCTLPYGTCEHTVQWLETTRRNIEMDTFKSELDREIDDVLNVFNDDFQVSTSPATDEVDISGMQWSRLEQRESDSIGATSIALFAPDERGWHSSVKLNDKLIAVFGGFRYKNNLIPQPFKSVPNPSEVEFMSDIRIYDIDNVCWFGVRARGKGDDICNDQPDGRYGHIAAALPGNRMLIYGGRGPNGKIFSDTWIYHLDTDRWEWIHNCEKIGLPIPAPRYFTSAVTIPRTSNVYLFGGTNGVENFGDLWIFNGDSTVLTWERLVAVGMPPCPRYGHQCVVLDEDQLVIIGGCHVSPSGEMVGSNISAGETKSLLELSSNLQKRYKAENTMARRGGQALETNIEYNGHNYDSTGHTGSVHLTDVYRQASKLSGSLHILEQDTRQAELAMMNTYRLSQASQQFHIHKAKHSTNHLDLVFLNIRETMWRTQIFPPIKGKLPCCRIHFGAARIANYLFVFGGVEPTSKAYKLVDTMHTQVNTLNLTTMRWDSPIPTNAADYLIQPLRVAEADVIRAKKRIDEEKFRGLSLGAKNGQTLELAEAEVVLKVCQWRRSVLRDQEKSCTAPPPSRFGCSLTSVGQRLFYCGGWDHERAVHQGEVMVLNIEQEHERFRRLDDEFKARLERDRVAKEAQENLANVQSVYELRAILFAERMNMEREQRDMTQEEIFSALPPLTKPKSVILTKANQHTMWIQWERITKNSSSHIIDPESVTYYLYMQVGFESLMVNDRVFATQTRELSDKQKKAMKRRIPKVVKTASHMFFDDSVVRYPGEIIKSRGNGTFDVMFDDGHIEKEVSRERIKLAPPLSETLLSSVVTRPGTSTADHSRPGTAASSRPSTAASVRSATANSETNHALSRNGSPSRVDRKPTDPVMLNLAPAVKSRITKKIRQKQKALTQLKLFRKPLAKKDDEKEELQSSKAMLRAARAAAKAAESSNAMVQDNHSQFMNEIDNLLFDHTSSNSNRPGSRGTYGVPTVRVDSAWKLVYAGNDCSYIVTHLVPTEALENEAGIVIPVAFCLQTHGLDSPVYERSQLSERVIFLTTKPAAIKTVEKSTLIENLVAHNNAEEEDDIVIPVTMSKTRKDIISAVINGQQMIQIERRNNAYHSQGMSDDYM